MFAIEPYSAEYQTYRQQPDGSLKSAWQPCRVLGIAVKDDEPAYVVECYRGGERWLQVEAMLRVNR